MIEDPLRELEDGLRYWKTRPKWPADLHNSFYRRRAEITDGLFTDTWWKQTLRDLHAWIATRNARHADLTERFRHHRTELQHAWASVIAPNLAGDITTVTWEQVCDLPALGARIKPTASGSGVFPSKLSHFIAPALFPVLDQTALPGGQGSYAGYFDLVRQAWAGTRAADRAALQERLTAEITNAGHDEPITGYPFVNKIVELRLIGRHHPA
ncbi:hypothetical protein [Actinoplanes sp. URMC 104]|uniref:hypothetical protein n=1 Tax=Actinoplanes sp. URMC 104 TaxID=3423409 RepID=UPI003F1A56C8